METLSSYVSYLTELLRQYDWYIHQIAQTLTVFSFLHSPFGNGGRRVANVAGASAKLKGLPNMPTLSSRIEPGLH